MRSVSVGLKPAITSSSSRSRGSVASARATSRRLRSGSVSVAAMRSRLSKRSSCCNRAWARERASPTSRRCSSAPMVTLSSTLSPGNGRTIWKVRAMPRRHTASAGRPWTGSPANVIEPPFGAMAPAIMLNSVVLPAPFGPMTAKIAPCGTAKLTRSTATRPRKRLLRPSTVSSAVICRLSPSQAGAPAAATPRPAAPRSRPIGTGRRKLASLPANRSPARSSPNAALRQDR